MEKCARMENYLMHPADHVQNKIFMKSDFPISTSRSLETETTTMRCVAECRVDQRYNCLCIQHTDTGNLPISRSLVHSSWSFDWCCNKFREICQTPIGAERKLLRLLRSTNDGSNCGIDIQGRLSDRYAVESVINLRRLRPEHISK